MNSCNFIGRLTRDPEIKNVNGKSLANFTLAIQESKDKSSFLDFSAWEKQADIISKFVKKGNQLAVSCKAVQETWDTPEGKKASKVKFTVLSVTLIGGKSDSSNSTEPESTDENGDPIF